MRARMSARCQCKSVSEKGVGDVCVDVWCVAGQSREKGIGIQVG